MRALSFGDTVSNHSLLLRFRESCRTAMRAGRPVDQTSLAFGTPTTQPLIRRLTGDTHRLGGMGHRPAKHFDPIHQQTPPKRRQTSRRVSHEGLLEIRGLHTHESNRQALTQSSVNNVPGKDT